MSSLPITEKFLAACKEYRVKLDQLERENAALRSLLREAITDYVSPYDLPEGVGYIARVKAALGEGEP